MTRFLLVPLLVLAACSSEPAAPVDSGPADTGAIDTPTIDVTGEDRNALPDFGPRDTGVDAGADIGEDRPGAVDLGADVPVDVVADAGCTELFCGGRCVDNSATNCGACGTICTTTVPHARPACDERDGGMVCEWGCEVGWQNCNHSDLDGCEYDVRGNDSGFCP